MLATFFSSLVELNHLAVFLAGLAAMVLGVLWYSPVLFLKPWMKLQGFDDAQMNEGNMPLLMFGGLINQWVMAYVLGVLIYLYATSTIDAVGLAVWVWLGLVATVQFGGVLWEHKAVMLWLIDTSYRLAALLLMALVLGTWL